MDANEEPFLWTRDSDASQKTDKYHEFDWEIEIVNKEVRNVWTKEIGKEDPV